MKKSLLFLLVTLLGGTTLHAYDAKISRIFYNFIGEDEAEVTRGNTDYTDSVAIPESVTYRSKTYRVTRIGDAAFNFCTSLRSVTIPESVTSIGLDAFSYCSSLYTIVIPDGITSVGEAAFSHTPWFDLQPDGLIYIGKVAYRYKGIMPEGTEITLKESTVGIAGSAFLTDITDDYQGGISNCKGLTSINIPNSVTYIGSCAFQDCKGLTSIKVPISVTSIGKNAFYGCSVLTSIAVEEGNANYDSRNGCNAIIETPSNTLIVGCQSSTIPDGVTSIGDWAFYGCTGLTSIAIPSSVTSIGSAAFSGCSSLTSITISESVTSIGASAFSNCSSLTSIIIPSSVTSIGNYAFGGCSSLTSITIPDGVTSIERKTFFECYSLSSVNIPESVTSIGEDAFSYCRSLSSVTIPDNVTTIETSAFWGCEGMKSLTIGKSVSAIKKYAFTNCTNLTSVTINSRRIASSYCDASSNFSTEFGPQVTEYIFGEEVRIIGHMLCYNCSDLTSVTIPKNVQSIGVGAFENCNNLTSVTMNSDAIASHAYDSYSNFSSIFGPQVTQYIFGDDVQSIGKYACYNCSNLTSVTLPDGLTNIGELAFYGTPWFDTWYNDQPEGLVYVGKTAYQYKGTMPDGKEIVIKDGTLGIADGVFSGCSGLAAVSFPNSLTSIGNSAFLGCTGLTSVHISDLAAWFNIYFGDNDSQPLNYAHHLYLNGEEIKNLVIPEGVTRIGNYTFSGCSSLISVAIPESVTNIAGSAFSGCTGLTSVTYKTKNVGNWFSGFPSLTDVHLGDEVEVIERGAFANCSGLTTLVIPENVKYIYSGALAGTNLKSIKFLGSPQIRFDYNHGFYTFDRPTLESVYIYDLEAWCKIAFPYGNNPLYSKADLYLNDEKVVDLVIPEGITELLVAAFQSCQSIQTATLPQSVTSLAGGWAFANCYNLKSINIPEGVTSIGEASFFDCHSLGSITIPENVANIGPNAFFGCNNLTSVTINSNTITSQSTSMSNLGTTFGTQVKEFIFGNNITNIGDYLCESCKNMTSVAIPEGVTSIGRAAFAGCSGLTSVTIPESVTSIGFDAFDGCSGLTSIIIPESVTSIGDYAFCNCSGLTSITIPENVTSIGDNAFLYCYFMKGSFVNNSALTNDNYWGATFYDEETDDGLLIKDNVVVKYRGTSTSVTIPDYVTGIGEQAFKGCSSLTSITIPAGVTSIGIGAFSNCSGLTSITIPAGVKSISYGAFRLCYNLTSITIPNSVTSIGEYAFERCTSLTSITIPNSVTSIGNGAFSMCSSLTSVTIPDGVTSIGSSAFYNCSSLSSITIPKSVTSIGDNIFYYCSGLTSVTINSDAVASKSYSNSSCISNIFGPQVTQYILGEGVQKIGKYAFYSCSNLLSVILPSSLTSIGSYAFQDCTGLKEIYCHAEEVPSATSYVFKGVTTSNVLLVVPDDAVEKYKAHSVWKKFMIEDATDTPSLMAEDRKADGIYDMSGRRVEKLQRGINIIRYSDGSTRKVMVK